MGTNHDPKTVLLTGVSVGQAIEDHCQELLFSRDDARPNVLCVSLINGPEQYLAGWDPAQFDQVHDLVMLAPDASVRSAAGADADSDAPSTNYEHVVLDAPGNIPLLGSRITDILYRWEKNSNPIQVCFDSLTVLTQFTSKDAVSRFVHVLRGHLLKVNAHSHFHIDPHAHDDQEFTQFLSQFDDVVDAQGDSTRLSGSDR